MHQVKTDWGLTGAGAVIYFVRNPNCGSIKIGFSKDPETRLAQLQTASPHRLELLGTIEGEREDEAMLHAFLVKWRMHGEWFRPTYEVETLIAFWMRHAHLEGQIANLQNRIARLEKTIAEQATAFEAMESEIARLGSKHRSARMLAEFCTIGVIVRSFKSLFVRQS